MIDERFEFLLSQYADGSLPDSERAPVALRLETDDEARALLEEYRTLDASLRGSMPLPAVNWDRLAAHLSVAVAEEAAEQEDASAPSVLGRIGHFGRLAIAACVVLAVGGAALWVQLKGDRSNTQVVKNTDVPAVSPLESPAVPPGTRPAPLVVVRGPGSQAAQAEPVVIVSVGPSSSVTPNWRAAEGVVTGPSRAIWIASTYDAAQDTQRLPY